jgi:Xaa-Pro aminopeptidase
LEPSDLAQQEWRALGLELPDLRVLRAYRLDRVRTMLRRFDYAGIVLYDPINIRYATDTSNMQVWCMHNAVRYCFIPTEGPVVLFEFYHCDHISQHLELVDEIRPFTMWFYLGAGPRLHGQARKWAAEIADLVRTHGGGNTRLALDRCNPEGIASLQSQGLHICNGEEIMELARLVKHGEEIKAMRCSLAATEHAIAVMREKLEPGVSEMRLWSYLHAENIARGGEWIETRLLASGPRTNPWYQECSKRIIQAGEMVAFDTDLIGPYGLCSDISRTWLCGDQPATAAQKEAYTMAYEQVQHNLGLIKPGLSFRELSEHSKRYPWDDFNSYTLLYHGVGLCDEYPAIFFPEHWQAFGNEGVLQENMVLCVESYVGRVAGGEGVKLEEQVLITRDGAELLSTYPYEHNLLFQAI